MWETVKTDSIEHVFEFLFKIAQKAQVGQNNNLLMDHPVYLCPYLSLSPFINIEVNATLSSILVKK